MGRAYFLDPRSVNLKEVNVLSRVGRDQCQIQDLFNTQITTIHLSQLRTVRELWDFTARADAALLPRGMREPVVDRNNPRYWRADRLPKELLVRAFED